MLKTRSAGIVVGLIIISVVAGVVAVYEGATPYVDAGNPYPGPLIAALSSSGRVLGLALAALSLGGGVAVATSSRPDRQGRLNVEVYAAAKALSVAAAAWLIVSVLMIPITMAEIAGLPFQTVFGGKSTPADWGVLLDASVPSKAWLVTAVAALIVWLSRAFDLKWTSFAISNLPAFIGVVALPVVGNVAQGPDHDYTTSLVLIFYPALSIAIGYALIGPLRLGRKGNLQVLSEQLQKRALIILGLAVAASVVTGLILLLILGLPVVDMFSVNSVIVGVGLIVLAVSGWKSTSGSRIALIISTISAFVALFALALATNRTAPALLAHPFTIWDVYLGYSLPEPVSFANLALDWRFDPFLGTGALVAAAGYIWAWRHVRNRGIDWPVHRVVFWLAGCVTLLIGTSSGLKTYGSGVFSVHMGNHMLVNMGVPVLLVIGGPITLLLRAFHTVGRRSSDNNDLVDGPREWLVRMASSRFSTVVTHPAFTFINFVASLYIVYLTPMYGELAKYHWWHELLILHFLVTGYLFFWTIIGVDLNSHTLPHMARLGLMLGVMPFHAFFGIALMMSQSVIADEYFSQLDLPWLDDLLRDQWLGGAIAWGSSEIPVVLVAIALGVKWYQHDQRTSLRLDRREDNAKDSELDAYNNMLADLVNRK